MKTLLSVLLLVILSGSTIAQYKITGQVIDEENKPLEYATIVLLNPADSTLVYFGVTNLDGEFQIKNINEGLYLMQYSFVGKKTFYKTINIPTPSGEDIGILKLITQNDSLGEVIIEAELVPLIFRNDTLEYNAKAFRTRPGAAVEELLNKLPGIEVDNSGNIKAEGEEVTKILVDGKEFFDDDPKVATKNLPAVALSKVQVIDRKSDESIFSGIDDGQREKTINLKLKEDYKKGFFGEISAGSSVSINNYSLSSKIYQFTEKTQNALLGMYNNVNESGFTNKDNNQFGLNNKGINDVIAGGFNLSFNPASENRYFVNYLGNRRDKDLIEHAYIQNIYPNGSYDQDISTVEVDIDQPSDLNFGLRHSFNADKRLFINGKITFIESQQRSNNITLSKNQEKLLNTQINESSVSSSDIYGWLEASYIVKLKNDKLQFKTSSSAIINDLSNEIEWLNEINFFDPLNQLISQQFQDNSRGRVLFSSEPSLLIKLKNSWAISFGAKFSMDENELFKSEGQIIEKIGAELLQRPKFTTNQYLISPSIILNRSKEKSQLNFQILGNVNQFEKIQDEVSIQKKKYRYLMPRLNYQFEYRPGRRINFRYTTNMIMPNPDQLIPVSNTINQLNIIKGNTDLEPEYRHQGVANWNIFDQFSFTSFSIRLSGIYTKEKIRWKQTISDDLIKITQPINVKNDLNFTFSSEFSTPIRALEININLKASESWSKSRVFINEQENINTNQNHIFNLTLENRKNTIFSTRLGAGINITDSKFSLADQQNNYYYNTSYSFDLRYTPNNRWNFQAKANILNYDSQSFNEAVDIPLINIDMSYFFFEAEKGSLTITAFDLLNQYTGFQRISQPNFLMQQEWNTLTRYIMLTFGFRFR